jgi:hypothetical protein
MTESLGRERITSVFHWVFLAEYLPRFLTIHNLDFVRPDKEQCGSAYEFFNTFCEWLGGAVCYSSLSMFAPRSRQIASLKNGRYRLSGSL